MDIALLLQADAYEGSRAKAPRLSPALVDLTPQSVRILHVFSSGVQSCRGLAPGRAASHTLGYSTLAIILLGMFGSMNDAVFI